MEAACLCHADVNGDAVGAHEVVADGDAVTALKKQRVEERVTTR